VESAYGIWLANHRT